MPFGFTGELQDATMGLVNLRARWYRPAQGQFVSRDPFSGDIEQPYSLHAYQYGYSDPVLRTDPSGKAVKSDPGPNTRDATRDLTSWLYREMMRNINDRRLQDVKRTNQNGNWAFRGGVIMAVIGVVAGNPAVVIGGVGLSSSAGTFYAMAMVGFANLVGDKKPWDFKHEIRKRLGKGISLCSNRRCRNNVEYSVPGNIHYGFVAVEAGYWGLVVQAGAGWAEYRDPAHKQPNNPYTFNGKFRPVRTAWGVAINVGDDPIDTRAIQFGVTLYRKYNRHLSFNDFQRELDQGLGTLAVQTPDARSVARNDANAAPYPVGYFNPR
jgi:RHS repeat-associated protein